MVLFMDLNCLSVFSTISLYVFHPATNDRVSLGNYDFNKWSEFRKNNSSVYHILSVLVCPDGVSVTILEND